MSGFGIFMLIFGVCVFFTGVYMYTGHEIGMLTWRPAFKNLEIDQWKNIGKWTMVVSVFIFLLAIAGLIFNFQ